MLGLTSPGLEAGHSVGAALGVLFALLISHAVADFALQNDFVARAKNRHADLSDIFPTGRPKGLWGCTLLAHALIHAGGVWLVTGFVTLGLAELILHLVIDFARCEGWLSFSVDQGLHGLCKAAFAAVVFFQAPAWALWIP